MPYNEDAREPSSVTGRAIGAVALVGALGGGGFLAHKGIKKGLKKIDNLATEKGVYAAAGDFFTNGSTKVKAASKMDSKDVAENVGNAIEKEMPTLKTNPSKRNIKSRSIG